MKQYPKLRVHKQLSFPDSKIGTAINKWTKDLSISLDREPKQIISQQNIDKLCSEFEELTIKNQISSTSLCQLVQKFTNIHDNEKAENYLEFCLSSSKQAAEASIDCHQCGQLGHIVSTIKP